MIGGAVQMHTDFHTLPRKAIFTFFRRSVIAALILSMISIGLQGTANAKARMVAVVVFHSTSELQPSALALTRQVTAILAQETGWDAKTVQPGTTATAGAEIAVIGQLLQDANGTRLLLSSFRVATDARVSGMTIPLNGMTLPENAGVLALLGNSADTNGTTPSSSSTSNVTTPNSLYQQTVPTRTRANAGKNHSITIPGGTALTVQLVGKISSSDANVGDVFAVKASKDVVVDGWVVIAAGAGGQGEVLSVDRAGSHGHAGTMGIRMDWIFAVDGEKIHLTNERNTQEGQNEAGVSSTMTIVSWALLGLPGLFVHNWVKGHDIELDGTHPLQAYTQDTVHVVSLTRSGSEAGFAQ